MRDMAKDSPLILAVGIPMGVAVLGLIGALVAALLSRSSDRQQQARPVLLEPAQEYARTALAALAALRYVTPPPIYQGGTRPHRNEGLLKDTEQRERRLADCREAIDKVRYTRARVRLVFHPKSVAAELSREVLAELRLSLEAAENYYASFDETGLSDPKRWRHGPGRAIRKQYKDYRMLAYQHLDDFFEDVAERLEKPTWDPLRIKRATDSNPLQSSVGDAAGGRVVD